MEKVNIVSNPVTEVVGETGYIHTGMEYTASGSSWEGIGAVVAASVVWGAIVAVHVKVTPVVELDGALALSLLEDPMFWGKVVTESVSIDVVSLG